MNFNQDFKFITQQGKFGLIKIKTENGYIGHQYITCLIMQGMV